MFKAQTVDFKTTYCDFEPLLKLWYQILPRFKIAEAPKKLQKNYVIAEK
jgi:hypothetical protein